MTRILLANSFAPADSEWGQQAEARSICLDCQGLETRTCRYLHCCYCVGTVAQHCGHFELGPFELLSQWVKVIIVHTVHFGRKPNPLTPSPSCLILGNSMIRL